MTHERLLRGSLARCALGCPHATDDVQCFPFFGSTYFFNLHSSAIVAKKVGPARNLKLEGRLRQL